MKRNSLYQKWTFFGLIGLLCQLSSCNKDNNTNNDYVKEIKQWQNERVKSLTKEDSWLSLAGLYWLEEGENRFGADPSNDIVFPEDKAPAYIGSFFLVNSKVNIQINEGINVFHQEKPIKSLQLQSDSEGEPTILRNASLSWYIIKRGDKFGVRLKDSKNSALLEFKGITTYPINLSWRVEAKLEPSDTIKTIEIPTVLGTITKEPCIGSLLVKIKGETYQLDPIGDTNSDRLFIIFSDETNGQETYGAGRFLYVDRPNPQGITFIDFNKAYNPPCAFTPYATCPLPPEQNHLPISITAGEKKYASYH